jgi:hypothetical protein
MDKSEVKWAVTRGLGLGALLIAAFLWGQHEQVPVMQHIVIRCKRPLVITYQNPQIHPTPIECGPNAPFDLRSNHGGEIFLP